MPQMFSNNLVCLFYVFSTRHSQVSLVGLATHLANLQAIPQLLEVIHRLQFLEAIHLLPLLEAIHLLQVLEDIRQLQPLEAIHPLLEAIPQLQAQVIRQLQAQVEPILHQVRLATQHRAIQVDQRQEEATHLLQVAIRQRQVLAATHHLQATVNQHHSRLATVQELAIRHNLYHLEHCLLHQRFVRMSAY